MNKNIFTILFVALVTILFANCDRDEFNKTEPTQGGVIIAGIEWARTNVAASGTFADNPEDAGMFFQWNRGRGWAVADEWGEWIYSPGGEPFRINYAIVGWDDTNAAGSSWMRINDPCPAGWRVPTRAELRRLADTGGIWTTQNGVNGHRFGNSPHYLFLPAAGSRHINGELGLDGRWGHYWSNAQGANALWAHILLISEGSTYVLNNLRRAHGFSVRCVAE